MGLHLYLQVYTEYNRARVQPLCTRAGQQWWDVCVVGWLLPASIDDNVDVRVASWTSEPPAQILTGMLERFLEAISVHTTAEVPKPVHPAWSGSQI